MVVLAPVTLALCGPARPLGEVSALVLVRLALVLTATALWVLLVPVLVRHTLPAMSPVSSGRGIRNKAAPQLTRLSKLDATS